MGIPLGSSNRPASGDRSLSPQPLRPRNRHGVWLERPGFLACSRNQPRRDGSQFSFPWSYGFRAACRRLRGRVIVRGDRGTFQTGHSGGFKSQVGRDLGQRGGPEAANPAAGIIERVDRPRVADRDQLPHQRLADMRQSAQHMRRYGIDVNFQIGAGTMLAPVRGNAALETTSPKAAVITTVARTRLVPAGKIQRISGRSRSGCWSFGTDLGLPVLNICRVSLDSPRR